MMAFSGAVKTLTLSVDVMTAGSPSVAGRGQRPRDRGYPFWDNPPRRRSLSTPREKPGGLLRRTDPVEWDPKSTNISFRGLSKLAVPERKALVGKCFAVLVYLLEWLEV
jgi:hypothetical protein